MRKIAPVPAELLRLVGAQRRRQLIGALDPIEVPGGKEESSNVEGTGGRGNTVKVKLENAAHRGELLLAPPASDSQPLQQLPHVVT